MPGCILSRIPINEYFIHRFITRNNPRNQIIYFRRNARIMFIYGHGNLTTLSALEQIQTYRETIRQKTVIPRTSPETSNYSELCRNDPRKRVSNTPKASARSLYRKPGSQTNKTFINHTENQVRINSVNQQTKSNMTPRQVSCNTQISTYQR